VLTPSSYKQEVFNMTESILEIYRQTSKKLAIRQEFFDKFKPKPVSEIMPGSPEIKVLDGKEARALFRSLGKE
jgi:hypothetical protein